jgi:hypothetical protein
MAAPLRAQARQGQCRGRGRGRGRVVVGFALIRKVFAKISLDAEFLKVRVTDAAVERTRARGLGGVAGVLGRLALGGRRHPPGILAKGCPHAFHEGWKSRAIMRA